MADQLDSRLSDVLDELASEDPAPGAGTAAALTASFAASILAMSARASSWDGAAGAAAQAIALQRRLVLLADVDADAYAESLAAMRLPERVEAEVRNMAIRDTLARAAAVPLLIAESSADIALLAIEVADRCEPALRADAVAAAQLADGSARAAFELVAVNLGVGPDDERLQLARRLTESASNAARRVATPPEPPPL